MSPRFPRSAWVIVPGGYDCAYSFVQVRHPVRRRPRRSYSGPDTTVEHIPLC